MITGSQPKMYKIMSMLTKRTTDRTLSEIQQVNIKTWYKMTQYRLTRRVPLWWSRNSLPFRSTRVHPRFLVRFVLLDLQFYVYALQIILLYFFFWFWSVCCLWFTDSVYPYGIFKLFIKNTRVECFVEDVVMTCLEQENNLKRVFHRPPMEI